MKVTLFGANGQLGNLVKQYAPEGVELFSFTSSDVDITSEDSVVSVMKDVNPDLVINAAAYTKVDKAEEECDAAYAVNETGPAIIAESAPKYARFIHVSTDFVFDGSSEQPYKPDDQTNPLGVYGASKLAGEHKVLELKPDNSVIIRTAWVYSADGANFVNTMLRLMRELDSLSVVSDQKGTPTSAHTLAEVIWKFALLDEVEGIYHWTDQGETTWYEFACQIQQEALVQGLLEKKIPVLPISTKEYPTPAKRPRYSVLDKTSTYESLGFQGKPWEDELNNVLAIKSMSH